MLQHIFCTPAPRPRTAKTRRGTFTSASRGDLITHNFGHCDGLALLWSYPAQHSNVVREEVTSFTVAREPLHAAVDVTSAPDAMPRIYAGVRWGQVTRGLAETAMARPVGAKLLGANCRPRSGVHNGNAKQGIRGRPVFSRYEHSH